MDGVDIPAQDEHKSMHISLPLGKDISLMASDTLDSSGQKLIKGYNLYIYHQE